jgi:hypothetical protein
MFLRHLLRAFHPTEPATPRRATPDRSKCAAVFADGPETTPSARPHPPLPGEAKDCSGRTEPSGSEGGKLSGENWPANLALSVTTSTETAGDFSTCRTTRDPQLYFPSEGRHAQDFLRPEKIRRLLGYQRPAC